MSLVGRVFELDETLLSRLEANAAFMRQIPDARKALETELRGKGYDIRSEITTIMHGLSEQVIVFGRSDMPSDIDFYVAAGKGMLPYRHRGTFEYSDAPDPSAGGQSPFRLPVFREFRMSRDDLEPLIREASFSEDFPAVASRLRQELSDKRYLLFSELEDLCYNGASLPLSVIVCGKRDKPSDLDFLAAASEPVRLPYLQSTAYEATGSNAIRSVTADMFLQYTLHVDRLAAQVTRAQFLQYASDPRSKCEDLRERMGKEGGILLESAEHFLGAPRHLLVGVFLTTTDTSGLARCAIETAGAFERKLGETRLPYQRVDPYEPLWRDNER